MKLKTYQYSVLKYRPSYFLGEEVNIGLLFLFKDDQKVTFIYPNKLARLTSFYPDVSLKTIRTYLKAFQQIAEKLEVATASTLDTSVLNHFLLEDASNLYFSSIKNGAYETVEQTVAYYREAYFHVYESPKIAIRKDEKYLNDRFSQQLAKYPIAKKRFQKNITIENELQQTKFDFAWKNGSVNLIKSISFDLKEKEGIQSKSFRWFGELTKLAPKAAVENLKFDLLIAKPQSSQLFKTYDKAIDILEGIKAPKTIIEEDQLDRYTEKAVEVVQVGGE